MSIEGETEWVAEAIRDRLLVAVTDRSYIRQLYPHLGTVSFVLECANRRGRIIRSFSESLAAANAYRGELLHGSRNDSILSAKIIRIAPENSSF
jgi:hypothetical protein